MNNDGNFEIDICTRCKGNCCREGVFITKKEYDNLRRKYKGILNCSKFMNGYRTKGSPCTFLSEKGCIIKQEERFIECKLFPLEIAGIDKLIVNKSAQEKCMGLNNFVTDEYYEKCYKLLKHYVSNGLVTREDVDSIIHNTYNL